MSPMFNGVFALPGVSAPGEETDAQRRARWEATLADLCGRLAALRSEARAGGYLADAARLDHICDLLSGDGL
jgi:hypothetical protein